MTMEIEYLNEEQLADQMRMLCQRIERENDRLRKLVAALLIVNGPLELPATVAEGFTDGWEVKIRRQRGKVIYSARAAALNVA